MTADHVVIVRDLATEWCNRKRTSVFESSTSRNPGRKVYSDKSSESFWRCKWMLWSHHSSDSDILLYTKTSWTQVRFLRNNTAHWKQSTEVSVQEKRCWLSWTTCTWVTPDPERVGAIYRWSGMGQLRRQIQGPKFGEGLKCHPISIEDLGSPLWPPRVRRSPVGEHVPHAGHSHPEDPIGPRSASRLVDLDAMRQCSGKLFAQSHQSPAGAAVRADARSEIVALFVRILGNRTRHVRWCCEEFGQSASGPRRIGSEKCVEDKRGRVLGVGLIVCQWSTLERGVGWTAERPQFEGSSRSGTQIGRRPRVRGSQWTGLLAGLRPPPRDQEDEHPIRDKSGWQHEAASRIEQEHRESLFRVLAPERALLRSQGGPGAGAAFHVCPTCPLTRIDPAHFRVLLLRRLRLPLPLSARSCRCGRPLDSRGHTTEQDAQGRGFWEDADTRWTAQQQGFVAREAHVSPQTWWSEIWTWRHQIMQMRVGWRSSLTGCHCLAAHSWRSTRPWSPFCTATGRHALAPLTTTAQRWLPPRRKERTYLELGRRGRARLVLVGEVGGRWSHETWAFLSQLARAKAHHEPHILHQRVQAWCSRWQAILSCTAAKAFARSLLESRAAVGADSDTPASHDVLRCFQGPGEQDWISGVFDGVWVTVPCPSKGKKKKWCRMVEHESWSRSHLAWWTCTNLSWALPHWNESRQWIWCLTIVIPTCTSLWWSEFLVAERWWWRAERNEEKLQLVVRNLCCELWTKFSAQTRCGEQNSEIHCRNYRQTTCSFEQWQRAKLSHVSHSCPPGKVVTTSKQCTETCKDSRDSTQAQIETITAIQFSAISLVVPFAIRYAGFVLSRFTVRPDGRTPFQYLFGTPCVSC